MTHILIPRTPSMNLLRPFIECPTSELDQAWAAMVRIAEVQHARAGSQCLQQIEEPAGAASAAVAPQGEYPPLPIAVGSPAWKAVREQERERLRLLAEQPAAMAGHAQATPALEAPGAPVGSARQFIEWMYSQPEDREPTTAEGALLEFEAHLAAAAPQAPAAPTPMAWPVAREELLDWARFADTAKGYSDLPNIRYSMGTLAMVLTNLASKAPMAAPAAPSAEGLREQHDRDSAELRRLCQARDEARRERDLARVEIAGLQASTGHLSALVDGQHALLEKAKATMTALHGSASPIDESGGDFDARIPASAFARFVDAHAELLHVMAQSPVAAPAAPAEGEVLVEVIGLTGSGKSAICGEIEILCRALGLDVSWPDGDPEKNMTHAEWTAAIEAYKPRVRIVERNVPRQSNGGPAK